MKDEQILNEIIEIGYINENIRNKYFYQWPIKYIRDFLEKNSFNRHLPIELRSTEIAFVTPSGIIMQIRTSDSKRLGFWGGQIEDGESIVDGAIREIREETGIIASQNDLIYVESGVHFHKYANKDIVKFHTYRFIIEFDKLPSIMIDKESLGYEVINCQDDLSMILEHQQGFVQRLLTHYFASMNKEI